MNYTNMIQFVSGRTFVFICIPKNVKYSICIVTDNVEKPFILLSNEC